MPFCIAKDAKFLLADNEDFDQTAICHYKLPYPITELQPEKTDLLTSVANNASNQHWPGSSMPAL